VERENLASDRSVRKAGFVPVAACSVWHLWKWGGRRWRPLTNREDWMRSWTIDTDRLPRTGNSIGEQL
jgi:hypothetical protein